MLTDDDFDQDLLRDMTCEHYTDNLESGEVELACDDVWSDPTLRYSPMVFNVF